MQETTVKQLSLTVSSIEEFKKTMIKLTEEKLWDGAEAYLKSKGKTELFVDLEALQFLHEHLEQGDRSFDNAEAFLSTLKHHTGG